MSDAEPTVVARYSRQVNDAFARLLGADAGARLFVRARDVRLWDAAGKEYLDGIAGPGTAMLGHNHPRMVERVRKFLGEDAPNVRSAGMPPGADELAGSLARASGGRLDACLFACRAADALDAAQRLAREVTGRPAILTVRSVPLSGSFPVPFGDAPAFGKAFEIAPVAALIVETIPVEAGVLLPPEGYLAQAQEACRRRGALLISDETRLGMGRTGTLFACTAEKVMPDVLVIGESLGGAIAPLAAALTRRELREKAGSAVDAHGPALAGLALGCAAGLETLAVLEQEKLAENAAVRGRELLEGLRAKLAGHSLVKGVRGRGLLVAVELGPSGEGLVSTYAPFLVEAMSERVFGQCVALRLFERGIVCRPAAQQGNVLLIEPPLVVSSADVDRFVRTLAEVLDEYQGVGPLVVDVAARLADRFRKAWGF